VASAIVLAIHAPFGAEAASLDGVSFLYPDDKGTYALGVSADGQVVVGYSSKGSLIYGEAFRWADGAIEDLGTLSGDGVLFGSEATAVNADGSVVVGISDDGTGVPEAFRWFDGTMTGLGYLEGSNYSYALAVDYDGSVVVGQSGDQAFRWVGDSTGGAMTGIGFLYTGASQYSRANGVNSDGSVIVGVSYNGLQPEAFRWVNNSNGGQMSGLGALPDDGYPGSEATAVSSDGSVVVGNLIAAYYQAFRWTSENGGTLTPLGFLNGGFESWTYAVSADGTIVVGSSFDGTDQEAFRWVAGDPNGMRSIAEILAESGVELGDWHLASATGISASGNTIVGTGDDPDGYQEGWIARFGAEPGLITEGNALNSLATLGKVPAAASGFVSEFMDTDSEYARNLSSDTDSEEVPLGYADDGIVLPAPRTKPRVRIFGYGLGGVGSDLQETSGTAMVGASLGVADNFVIGASGGYGSVRGDMSENGKANIEGPAGTLFAAYAPWSGFQFLAAGAVAGFDAKITRGYMNGEGTAFSSGSTAGDGYGGVLRIGYAASLSDHARIEPFASFKATHVSLNGYTEHGGPFPADVGSLSQTDEESLLGAETRLLVGRESWVWGSAAWGHRYEGSETTVSAQLIDLFGVSGSMPSAQTDWAELTAGTSVAMTAATRLTASLTADCFDDGSVSGSGRLGVNMGF
jgi:probable HAF family extracellular repeat protein